MAEKMKCPKCGRKMTRNMRVGDFFKGSNAWVRTCFFSNGGCGYEEADRDG
jgi:predicted nucleic acid-binding Zn ribbon protein